MPPNGCLSCSLWLKFWKGRYLHHNCIFSLKFSWFLVLIYIRLKPKKLKLAELSPESLTCCQIKEIGWFRYSSLVFQSWVCDHSCLIWAEMTQVTLRPQALIQRRSFQLLNEYLRCLGPRLLQPVIVRLTVTVLVLHIIKCIIKWWEWNRSMAASNGNPRNRMAHPGTIIMFLSC